MKAVIDERIFETEHALDSYVDVEVAGVATEGSELFTVDDDVDAEFFSVYLRTEEGFAECVADVATRQRAQTIADGFVALIGLDDDDDDIA
ncbi:MAG TPA: hypothetical protein VGF99_07715 [Myxococcota bacterium]